MAETDRRLRGFARALTAAAFGIVALGAWDVARESAAEAKESKAGKGRFEYGCRVQKPQKFLTRRSFHKKGRIDPAKHAKALRYLIEHYGNAEDEATSKVNPQSARSQAKTVQFFGMPIAVHAKIAPALACVEKRLQKSCTGGARYAPRALGGFRQANTYRGTEVSNHLFGIAIDIDPDRNPCCGCVDPWPSSPLCRREVRSAYERTALPKCWITAFERFGFDWLGHDELEDTMHFEFLGDPDRITK